LSWQSRSLLDQTGEITGEDYNFDFPTGAALAMAEPRLRVGLPAEREPIDEPEDAEQPGGASPPRFREYLAGQRILSAGRHINPPPAALTARNRPGFCFVLDRKAAA